MAFYLKQGKRNLLEDIKGDETELNKLQDFLSNLCNTKHINFLLGSGASSTSIPTMLKMAEKVEDILDEAESKVEGVKPLYESLKYKYNGNLEEILGILYSKQIYDNGVGSNDPKVSTLASEIEEVIYREINVDIYSEDHSLTVDLYKLLYDKMSKRSRDLPRLNVFTTNNDLFNEAALDLLGIDYNNGFGGGLKKLFNPSRFNYSYSKASETLPDRYEAINNMVYLYKLHGSINWREFDSGSYFLNIEEFEVEPGTSNNEVALIYPTPLKQNKSLGTPYADIMREFKAKISIPNSVLFVIGYSFSDEHVNNFIYYALSSNSSLSVVLFGDFEDKPIYEVGDNRVFSIYGKHEDGEKVHYFKSVVERLLPDLDADKKKDFLKEFSEKLNDLVRQQ
ncbi:SIR2 family protein [Larsenimonas suaedae]|uniref:SIR2 family protein n=1 Tax=Larsenimonas suaedae TaxID=1851019 RepID=A0ABU1GSL4_9GAMM|nr:SIR2 family protein [Larsenimonas suaedae]MCM2972198.1 SIR2 family protein [Larsenimonas suaedae]MDR5895006.1 SIR2 family protein [Larsenimonas suaedae]